MNPFMMSGPFGYASWAPMVLLLALWSLFWKGLALWHAAQRGDRWWFAGILVFNTMGIVEIIYLFLVLKMKGKDLFTSKVALK